MTTEPILNQPWEDVADDVTGAIEKAVQPLLKKAVDDIYSGLLDSTQDYLKDNLAFNIASRIDCAEREAANARQRADRLTAILKGWRDWYRLATADDECEYLNGKGWDDAEALAESTIGAIGGAS